MTLMGIVRDFKGILICRLFLGLAAAAFFPGAAYIVSIWYPRHELQNRVAIFYTASAFSDALSGLLAFGIARMDGLRDISGWRWIFLIEGAVTVVVACMMPFLIIDSPERAKWLSDDERRFMNLRLQLSRVRAKQRKVTSSPGLCFIKL